VRAATAVSRIRWVSIKVGNTGGLAADWETSRIKGAFELGRAIWAQINRTRGYGTALIVVDSHRKVVPIDERDIIPVMPVSCTESPFPEGCGRNTGTCMGVTDKATIAATIKTRIWPRVGGKIAVAAGPDTASGPVIGHRETLCCKGRGLPSRHMVWDSGSNIKVGKNGWPDGEWASVVHCKGTGCSRRNKGDGGRELELHA
jgi:hypothetical protein